MNTRQKHEALKRLMLAAAYGACIVTEHLNNTDDVLWYGLDDFERDHEDDSATDHELRLYRSAASMLTRYDLMRGEQRVTKDTDVLMLNTDTEAVRTFGEVIAQCAAAASIGRAPEPFTAVDEKTRMTVVEIPMEIPVRPGICGTKRVPVVLVTTHLRIAGVLVVATDADCLTETVLELLRDFDWEMHALHTRTQ